MADNRTLFGVMPDGTETDIITLSDGPVSCRIITYGGALQALTVPDREGRPVDVVLGFDSLDAYRAQDKYMGALIGRFANRIGNARFLLNGQEYTLAANDGKNHLHGGVAGFDKQVWAVTALSENSVTLSLTSPDGQEGYPGTLTVAVTYRLADSGLEIDYRAETDADTVCNLTNHAYFNLSGHDSGPVTDQYIQLEAGFYTPTDAHSIPNGAVAPVDKRPMDLRNAMPIGARIDEDYPQLTVAGGYDHNWAIYGPTGTLRPAARAWSPRTGILMETLTTQPAIQFYTGNYLDDEGPAGKGGAVYGRRHGFCLETQCFPNAPNVGHFPGALLRPGEIYSHKTIYRFATDA